MPRIQRQLNSNQAGWPDARPTCTFAQSPGALATATVEHPWPGALGIFKSWLVFAARFFAHNSGIFAFGF